MLHFKLLLVFLIPVFIYCQVPDFQYTHLYPNTDKAETMDIVVDVDEKIYAVGVFRENVELGNDILLSASYQGGWPLSTQYRRNSYIYKSDVLGQVEWAELFYSDKDVQLFKIEKGDNGNIFVAGRYEENLTYKQNSLTQIGGEISGFIAKLDENGDLIWITEITSSDDLKINDIQFHNGNLYFAGYSKTSLSYGGVTINSSGKNDLFVAKMNSSGAVEWLEKAGGSYSGDCGLVANDNAQGLSVDHYGNVIITGNYYLTADFQGSFLTQDDVVDSYIAKYSPDGLLLWVERIGGDKIQVGVSVDNDSDNNLYVLGRYNGSVEVENEQLLSVNDPGGLFYDMFVVKFNPDGELVWLKSIGDMSSEYPSDIIVDMNDDVFISGVINGDLNVESNSILCPGASRMIVLKYDNDGDFKYVKDAGSYQQRINALDINENNDVYLAGVVNTSTSIPIVDFSNFQESLDGAAIFHSKLDNEQSSVGIVELPFQYNSEVFVYPNPSHGIFEIGNTPSDIEDNLIVELYNSLGQQLGSYQYSKGRSVNSQSILNDGVYTVLIRNGQSQILSATPLVVKK